MKFHYLGKVLKNGCETQKEWSMRILDIKRFLEGSFPDNEFKVYNSDAWAIFLYRRRK